MKAFSWLIACVPLTVGVLPACSSTTLASGSDGGTSSGTSGAPGGSQCTQARDQLLVPVDKVSTAQVKVVSQTDGVTTIYVDASAGGISEARKNPRVYITLDGNPAQVTDKEAPASGDWDLALKRVVIFTNGGDAGPGQGGGAIVRKAFDAVTAADADAAPIAPESFFDADCNSKTDEIQDPQTAFTGWYDYDGATMKASAKKGVTFIVKSAAGVRYKVGVVSNTGKPDGTMTAPATGFYLLKVAPL
jgi:hypothetical protein